MFRRWPTKCSGQLAERVRRHVPPVLDRSSAPQPIMLDPAEQAGGELRTVIDHRDHGGEFGVVEGGERGYGGVKILGHEADPRCVGFERT